ALRAVGDRDVADLPGDAACPAPQLTVDDQAGGQAGAEVEVGHGAHLITERVVGAECGGLHVILDAHGQGRPRRHEGGQVEVFDVEVDRVRHPPGHRVHRAGDADADGGDA